MGKNPAELPKIQLYRTTSPGTALQYNEDQETSDLIAAPHFYLVRIDVFKSNVHELLHLTVQGAFE